MEVFTAMGVFGVEIVILVTMMVTNPRGLQGVTVITLWSIAIR